MRIRCLFSVLTGHQPVPLLRAPDPKLPPGQASLKKRTLDFQETIMKTTRLTLLALSAVVAIPSLMTVTAQAATLPTIVVMHRNIQNVQDEKNWQELAIGLSDEGYRVVSVAMERNEAAATAAQNTIDLLNRAGYNDKLVVVGTASASDAISALAQAEPTKVKALVYVSASDAVPTFGPRSVTVPSTLTGIVPTFQVKVVAGKNTASTEGGQTTFKVREQGNSTLGRTTDMVAMIDHVHAITAKG